MFHHSGKTCALPDFGARQAVMNFLKSIFTWWNGATIGTALFSWRHGVKVGIDSQGNSYYRSKRGDRRWVIYSGPNDAALIPPDWHGWLHHQIEGLPGEALPPPLKFQKATKGNRTGMSDAYRPSGALEKGGQRQAASGDYQAWTPR
jgi:NADH:ubiquinone oxidoreductase subunit